MQRQRPPRPLGQPPGLTRRQGLLRSRSALLGLLLLQPPLLQAASAGTAAPEAPANGPLPPALALPAAPSGAGSGRAAASSAAPPQAPGRQPGTPTAPAPGTAPATTASGPAPLAPFTSLELKALLRNGSLEDLALGCQRAMAEDRLDRLRMIRDRLLTVHPAPQPLAVILANAEVLLSCLQPEAALTVLERISPAPGAERVQWLLMQWRAANAALDHRRAAQALERLTAAQPERLDTLLLPVLRRDDGSVVSRPAMDLLADHQRARGFPQAAAQLLLASQDGGVAGAERRLEAVRMLRQLPAEEREALLESALEQAAAAGAWGLVAELLDAQAALPSPRAVERRLRLSPRIDDAYGEWRLRRQDPDDAARTAELERRLRSPQGPGGHSAEPPAPAKAPATAPLSPPPAKP